MSRNYEVTLKVKGIVKETIEKYIKDEFGTIIDMEPEYHLGEMKNNGVFIGTAEVCLCAGMMENDAHEKISEYFKAINAQALVQTQWTDLEDLPFEEYGDEMTE